MITFPSLTKLHCFQEQFQVFNYLCSLAWFPVCQALSQCAEKTNHSAFPDTIFCPSKDGPLSEKVSHLTQECNNLQETEAFFQGKRMRYSAFVQKMAESSSELQEKILMDYSKNL